jgi:hypothetical protein
MNTESIKLADVKNVYEINDNNMVICTHTGPAFVELVRAEPKGTVKCWRSPVKLRNTSDPEEHAFCWGFKDGRTFFMEDPHPSRT